MRAGTVVLTARQGERHRLPGLWSQSRDSLVEGWRLGLGHHVLCPRQIFGEIAQVILTKWISLSVAIDGSVNWIRLICYLLTLLLSFSLSLCNKLLSVRLQKKLWIHFMNIFAHVRSDNGSNWLDLGDDLILYAELENFVKDFYYCGIGQKQLSSTKSCGQIFTKFYESVIFAEWSMWLDFSRDADPYLIQPSLQWQMWHTGCNCSDDNPFLSFRLWCCLQLKWQVVCAAFKLLVRS